MFRRSSTFCICAGLFLSLPLSVGTASFGADIPLDPIMGEFAGTLTPVDGQPVKAEVKVIADEDSKYRIVLLYPAGDRQATRIELGGKGQDGDVTVNGGDWAGKVTKDSVTLKSAKVGAVEANRTERKSPTLGQKPPVGAIVLLPYEEGKPTSLDHWSNKNWVCEPDGSILVRQGDTATQKQFGSYKLHVEFRVPFMPKDRGQGRGNSGVYQHARYEIQVLDSFGLTMNPGECGAIYGKKAPDVNASLPPGQWQTYDIDFTAPEFDAAGKQTKGAIISVLHNGVKIHDAIEVTEGTGGAWGKPAPTGQIRLQDHGNPMRFRNIWLVETSGKSGKVYRGPTGLQLYSLRDMQSAQGVEATLDKAVALGFKYVEVAALGNFSPAQFKAQLDRRGLVPIGRHFPFEQLRDNIEGVARDAKALGIPYVGCAWIPHQGPFSPERCREAAGVFNRAGAALAKHGLKFYYHNHGYEFEPYENGTLFDLLAAETDPKTVYFQMDVLWTVFPGQDPARLLEKYPGRWLLMHLKDLRRGVPTGSLAGGTALTNDVALGTGQVQWVPLLRAAQKVGIKYYFIEDESPSVLEQIPQSLRFLESLAGGKRIFSTGHSFHAGFAPVLAGIAKSAGCEDGAIVGISNIGGSKVIQHWGGKAVQAALTAGAVDVLMTTPIYLPDPGVEKFAQLGFEHNPDFHLTMMEFWLPFDRYEPRYYISGPAYLPPPKSVDHNAATAEGLRQIHQRYVREMDAFVSDLNKKLGKQVVLVVPVGQAVNALREKIMAGQAPGLNSQEDIFTDGLGHPKAPLTTLMGYCHYAVIYGKSPVGLPVPDTLSIPGDRANLPALNRLLQELAWDAVTHHPLSGVKAAVSSK